MTAPAHRLRIVVRQPRKAQPSHADRWREYERLKREIADSARSSQEYEERLRRLSERLWI
jgi:hypothetical protein